MAVLITASMLPPLRLHGSGGQLPGTLPPTPLELLLFLLLLSLSGAFRGFAPALVLSILDPKLTWSEAEQQAAVQQVGGAGEGSCTGKGRQRLGEWADTHASTSRLGRAAHPLSINRCAMGMYVDTRCTHPLVRLPNLLRPALSASYRVWWCASPMAVGSLRTTSSACRWGGCLAGGCACSAHMAAPPCRTACAPDMRIMLSVFVPLVPLLRPCGPPTRQRHPPGGPPLDSAPAASLNSHLTGALNNPHRPMPTAWWTTTSSWTWCPRWPPTILRAACRRRCPTRKPPSWRRWACSSTRLARWAGALPSALPPGKLAGQAGWTVLELVRLHAPDIGGFLHILLTFLCTTPPLQLEETLNLPVSQALALFNKVRDFKRVNALLKHTNHACPVRAQCPAGVATLVGFLKCKAPIACLLIHPQAGHNPTHPTPRTSASLAHPPQALRRLHGLLRAAKEAEAERSLPRPAMATVAARASQLAPHEAELDAELDEAAEVRSACIAGSNCRRESCLLIG